MGSNVEFKDQHRVLVVEDDDYARDVLKGVVSRLGHTPLEASNVPKALSLLKDEPINMMLLDIYLKGATGLDLLKALQRRDQAVPTVVVSGHISDAVAHQLIQYGVQGLISKPFSLQRVAAEIHKVIPTAGDLTPSPLQNGQAVDDGQMNERSEAAQQHPGPFPTTLDEQERRSGNRIRMKLPIRARAANGKHFYMRLVDVSSTGMQTHGKNLEILKIGSANEGFRFEIPVVARLARINSAMGSDEGGAFSIGWEFDRIIQLYADPSMNGQEACAPDTTAAYSGAGLNAMEKEWTGPVDAGGNKRRDRRIAMRLPIRAKVGAGRNLEMTLVDISSTGMQTLAESLEILELKHVSATQQFVFEIPLVARLAWIHSRTDETFAVGWAFEDGPAEDDPLADERDMDALLSEMSIS